MPSVAYEEIVDLDDPIAGDQIRELGRMVIAAIRTDKPKKDLSKVDSREIARALRARYASTKGVAVALGYTPGTKEYKSAQRSIERQIGAGTQSRAIGPAWRQRYETLPLDIETRERLEYGPIYAATLPDSGAIVLQYHSGTVIIRSQRRGGRVIEDERERNLPAMIVDEPASFMEVLRDPLGAYMGGWGGPEFGGIGTFVVAYEGDE